MSETTSHMLFGGLGGPELILVAAIGLLLAGASRLFARQGSHKEAGLASSRAYLNRLLGTARRASRPTSLQERALSRERASTLEIGVS